MCISRSRFFSACNRSGRASCCVCPDKCCLCVADFSCRTSIYKRPYVQFFWGLQKKKHLAFHILCLLPLLQDQCLLLVIWSCTYSSNFPLTDSHLAYCEAVHIFLNSSINQKLVFGSFADRGYTSHHSCYNFDCGWTLARLTIACPWWPSCSLGSQLQ